GARRPGIETKGRSSPMAASVSPTRASTAARPGDSRNSASALVPLGQPTALRGPAANERDLARTGARVLDPFQPRLRGSVERQVHLLQEREEARGAAPAAGMGLDAQPSYP